MFNWILNHWLTQEKFWVAAGAFVTLLAVLVALFQEKLKDIFKRAKLKVEINLSPPDSHKIKSYSLPIGSTGVRISHDLIYIRIKVEHIKGDPAKNVEVMLVRVSEIKGKVKTLRKNFIPLNLTWANRQVKEDGIKIPSGLFRYCDLGYLYQSGEQAMFHFDTIVEPNEVGDENEKPNIISKGKYEIEVWVSGDNTETIKKKWILEFDGKWSSSQKEMLGKHLKVIKI